MVAFLAVVFLAGVPETRKSDPLRFVKDFEKFAELDKTNPPPTKNLTLFTGSSTIRRWNTLAKDFPEIPVLNRGFGGSQLNQVLHHFDDLFPRYKPVRIVLYCGENDLWSGKPPKQVFADFIEFTKRVHAIEPKTKIHYLAAKPSPKRMSKWVIYQTCNHLIADHANKDKRLNFVDVSKVMLDKIGQPLPNIWLKDKLHMNATGYARWTELLTPMLAN